MKNLNKKMIIMMASVVGVIIVLIIVLMLFAGGGSKKLDYSKIEDKIIAAGENYYSDHEDKLPKSGTESMDVATLVAEGYINELSRYTAKDVSCSGKLHVTKTPSGYSYRSSLNCGDTYTTKNLKSAVMDNLVTSGNGLYETEQVDPNNTNSSQKVYVFRGDNVSNYVKIGDYLWEIVKVYENGEVAVLGDPELLRTSWDNRYNVDTKTYRGINDYAVSRMRDTIIAEVINDVDGYLNIKKFITTHTACIGKRNLSDTSKDGSIECSKTLTDQYFSLLPVYDFMNASLDGNCTKALDDSCFNYNYLSSLYRQWWTGTGVGDNTQDVYYLDTSLKTDFASHTNGVRLYAHLEANTIYVSGNGTKEEPYIVK